MKLTKSLLELDNVANELLAKSNAKESQDDNLETKDVEDTQDELKPDDISKNTSASTDKEVDKDKSKEEDEDENVDTHDSEDEEDENEDVDKDKSKEEDVDTHDSEDEEDENENEEDEDEETPEDYEQSVKDDMEADDTVKKSMTNNAFLSAIADILAKSLGDVQYGVHTQGKQQEAVSDILAKSLQAVITSNQSLQSDNERLTRRLNKLEKSVNKGFDKLMDCLDDMASRPAYMRKSVSSIAVHDRDFGSSINGVPVIQGFESLSKSQVLSILNNELYSGSPSVTPNDIISYESGAPLREDLKALVASKYRQ